MSNVYSRENFESMLALEKLGGDFAALGFLWVLREILGGKSEGIVDLKALASSLNVNIGEIYSFIGHLEDSFIISTNAEPEGRRIKILVGSETEEAVCLSQDCADFLTNYLSNHGIIPRKPLHNQEDNEIFRKAALNLGNNFALLKGFYSAVKSTLNDHHEFTYSLNDDNIALTDTGRITQFANGLNILGFLSSYSYKKSPHRIITSQVAANPEAHRFISGGWLEEWAYCRAISSINEPYSYFRNLNATLPENEAFEFDIIICKGEKIFWSEAKTARYSAYVPKYSRIAGLLELPASNVILVSPDAPSRETQQGITCCNLEGFPEVIAYCM